MRIIFLKAQTSLEESLSQDLGKTEHRQPRKAVLGPGGTKQPQLEEEGTWASQH